MIPTRTKQISVYGKRSKRIIVASSQDVNPDAPDKLDKLIHRMKKRENSSGTIKSIVRSKASSSPRLSSLPKQRSPPNALVLRNSVKQRMRLAKLPAQDTTRYPLSGLHEQKDYNKKNTLTTLSSRMPLSSLSTNITNSPSSVKVSTRTPKKKESSPRRLITSNTLSTVQMDIIVVDSKGKMIKQEKRTARTDAIVSRALKPTRTARVEILTSCRHHSVSSSSVPAVNMGSLVDATSGNPNTLSNTTVRSDDSSEMNGTEVVNDTDILIGKPQNRHRLKRALTNVILSDDDDERNGDTELEATYLSPETSPPPLSKSSRSLLSQTQISILPEVKATASNYLRSLPQVEVAIPLAPDELQLKLSRHPPVAYKTSYDLIPSPLPKLRQLTPIRRSQDKGLTAKNSLFAYGRGVPPSPTTPTDTDSDLSFEFSQIDIGISRENLEALRLHDPDIRINYPQFLKPLLEECHQEACGPYEFSAFIKSFPFDPILQDSRGKSWEVLQFKKIGEASYSEVFGIGDVVLKVIPLHDESCPGKVRGEVNEPDGPAPSEVKDVRKEIIVTRAMGEVHEGYVKLLKTYIVRGKYPEVLLNLWDEYNEGKGSESVRPDTFTPSQTYAIIVLPNDGPDLEAYTFSNASKTGWRKASSLFWQVTKALAHAEELVAFEHRDLHWGQILIKGISTDVTAPRPTMDKSNQSQGEGKSMRVFMDDLEHGVQATIIDLGLSRMDGSNKVDVHWTPFDEEVFMGEGDYQFDVYRLMREHTNSDWKGYHPLTNVMWLHYLVTKLLRHKNLKAPMPRKLRPSTTTSMPAVSPHISENIKITRVNRAALGVRFSERECYDSLVDIEDWLGRCIAEAVPRVIQKPRGKYRSKKTTTAPVKTSTMCACAREVVVYGVKRGWIQSVLA